ncbi:MAG: S41 family peptidase [Candidatus Komeilibacteria bacterium]
MEESLYSITRRKNITTLVVIVLILLSFIFGFFFGRLGDTSQDLQPGEVYNLDKIPEFMTRDVNFELFWQVWDLLKMKYLYSESISNIDLFYGSLAGSVAALGDPYSVFFNPDIAGEFTEELNGRFEGIGAEIGIKQGRLTIVAPLPDTPAEKAGIRAGDQIYAIDGFDTTNMSLDKAISMIRGEGGTVVTLMIIHKDDDQPQDIEIVRGTININSVQSEMYDDVAYVRITHFNIDTGKRFKEIINNVLQNDVQAIVLDLRNNPGGFMDIAIELGGYWIDNDVMVREEYYDQARNKAYQTQGLAVLEEIPTYVLINGGSASASEILAGALQDYGLATLIGETTFGKGSIQELEQLSDGSALKITVAEWHTPLDRAINEIGIEPDIVVEFSEEDYNNDIDTLLDEALNLIADESNHN